MFIHINNKHKHKHRRWWNKIVVFWIGFDLIFSHSFMNDPFFRILNNKSFFFDQNQSLSASPSIMVHFIHNLNIWLLLLLLMFSVFCFIYWLRLTITIIIIIISGMFPEKISQLQNTGYFFLCFFNWWWSTWCFFLSQFQIHLVILVNGWFVFQHKFFLICFNFGEKQTMIFNQSRDKNIDHKHKDFQSLLKLFFLFF